MTINRPAPQDLQPLFDAVAQARWPAAETLARDFTQRFAAHPLGWKALAMALAAQGDDAQALGHFDHALQCASGGTAHDPAPDPDTHCYRGHALKRLQRLAEAEAAYRQALALRPAHLEALNHLAAVLFHQGRLAEAEAAFRQALALQPGDASAHANLGVMLKHQGRLAAAEAAYRQALAIDPAHPDALNNLGVLLNRQDRRGEAETVYQQALALRPADAATLTNLGLMQLEQGRMAEAEVTSRQALAADPGLLTARSNLLFILNHGDDHSAQAMRAEALEYGRRAAVPAAARFSRWLGAAQPQRLRVGLVSGDLRTHPVGYFLEAVLGPLAAAGIELIAYPTHPGDDAMSQRLRAACAAWKPLQGLSDQAAAALIHADGVHLLLDLSGHTAHNRLPVFAHRPAPLQASWLGYFATTGLAEMDGLIADPVSVPPGDEAPFTEAVWRLPHTRLCFTPPLEAPPVAPLPALACGHVTFGCFQNLSKVNQRVLATWAAVLSAVPGARLRLQGRQLSEASAAAALLNTLQTLGIDRERIDLHGGSTRAAYLAAHGEVDVLLDTFPFPGGTTTCEALWMGVPTVTLAGSRLLGRQGASLLSAAGLADWVATDEAGYVARAVAAAQDLPRLAALRAGLRAQVAASPVFDAPRFASDLAALLWQRWRAASARYAGAMPAPHPATNATNAAILYQPEAFDTRGEKLMGRQAAGESFLKGWLQHSGVDTLYCYAGSREHAGHFQRLVAGFGNQRPVHWLDSHNPASPRTPGTLYLPDPGLGGAAWRRRAQDQRLYSLAGITHTIASAGAMDLISEVLTAPVQDWDALVCTSAVVRESVELLLGEQQAFLAERLGATHFTRPQLPVIPLGVNSADFAPDEGARTAARAALGIADTDVVMLFVGRLSFHAKAHPLPMYLGLERAAQALARQHGGQAPKLRLLMVGWFANAAIEAAFRGGAAQFCPSVDCRFIDGRAEAPRRQAWQAADVFTSLSDNVQESFGLTPIEAMAAGLPGVVSDWNGYRDTVRDGVDGLRVPTLMPRAGLGTDLADRHAAGLDNYDIYCGSASQFVAIDPDAAAAAYLRLITDAPLRRRMGAAARQRALAVFDWAVVIPQYQALWQQLAERRQIGAESATRRAGQSARPTRADPFFSFAGYASQVLSASHRVRAAEGADGARLQTLLQSPLMSFMARLAPDADACGRLLAELQRRGPLNVDALLAGTPDAQRLRLERGLVCLAKLGLLHIEPPAGR